MSTAIIGRDDLTAKDFFDVAEDDGEWLIVAAAAIRGQPQNAKIRGIFAKAVRDSLSRWDHCVNVWMHGKAPTMAPEERELVLRARERWPAPTQFRRTVNSLQTAEAMVSLLETDPKIQDVAYYWENAGRLAGEVGEDLVEFAKVGRE